MLHSFIDLIMEDGVEKLLLSPSISRDDRKRVNRRVLCGRTYLSRRRNSYLRVRGFRGRAVFSVSPPQRMPP